MLVHQSEKMGQCAVADPLPAVSKPKFGGLRLHAAKSLAPGQQPRKQR